MKDEIKEILDNKLYFDLEEEDYIKIKDYITNLKKEIRINNDLIPYFKNKEKSLKKEITNLQNKIKQYEDPEDLTLFYMWLDEKAKDKMKQLQDRIKELEAINEEHRRINGELRKTINEAIDYIEYQISQLDFEKDTKAKMLGSMVLVLLQGSDE